VTGGVFVGRELRYIQAFASRGGSAWECDGRELSLEGALMAMSDCCAGTRWRKLPLVGNLEECTVATESRQRSASSASSVG